MTFLKSVVVAIVLMELAMLAFTALSGARKLVKAHVDKKIKLPMDWLVLLIVLMAVGTVGDFVFNVLRGTFIFGRLPKELLFSHRIQRYVDEGRNGQTDRWFRILNTGDEGHIQPKR